MESLAQTVKSREYQNLPTAGDIFLHLVQANHQTRKWTIPIAKQPSFEIYFHPAEVIPIRLIPHHWSIPSTWNKYSQRMVSPC